MNSQEGVISRYNKRNLEDWVLSRPEATTSVQVFGKVFKIQIHIKGAY